MIVLGLVFGSTLITPLASYAEDLTQTKSTFVVAATGPPDAKAESGNGETNV